jgi:asparagine N-glycosylation enzyme membrane subunit Stt3
LGHRASAVTRALWSLTVLQRRYFILTKLKGFSYSEIARLDGKYESTIRRLAENVGVLSKFYYMMRYSLLKTYAGKYRTTVSKIKKRYMHDGIFRVPYETKSGRKICELYHDGFRIVTADARCPKLAERECPETARSNVREMLSCAFCKKWAL